MDLMLPLQGLFLHLVRSGFPLSVRNYQDALVALRRGYGSPRREDLHWLCTTLWARTDQEVSRIDRLFREFRWPSPEEVGGLVDRPVAQPTTLKRRKKTSQALDQVLEQSGEKAQSLIDFVAPSELGVGLPSASTPDRNAEVFIFTRRPLLPLRSLVIAWRRLRFAQRSGPRVELDIAATIAEQSRRGILTEPVLLPARRNQARLVVLMDLGKSMVTWRHMTRLLVESLATSRLAHAVIYFFDEAPDDEIYEQETLGRPIAIERALHDHPGCSLVVVSDAGAAMGIRDRERIARIRRFISAVRREWSPIAWLNPMPPARWKSTSADDIARMKAIDMSPFTDDGLIQAVDYLRGRRS